jgi:predicted O-linked N-acetylglucosamine transferase (SPINDLY family)
MISLYINKDPCRRLKLICYSLRIKINKYKNDTKLNYPCIILKKNGLFCKEFYEYLKNIKIKESLIIGFNYNFICDENKKIKILKFKDLLFKEKIEVFGIFIKKGKDNYSLDDYFKYENYKNYDILKNSLIYPVKYNEITKISSPVPNNLKKYCSFDNANKYQLTILESNITNNNPDWISYFKKHIFNYELNLFIILDNNLEIIKKIKDNYQFYKIIIYKIDYDKYDYYKKKYIIINNFKNIIKIIRNIGFSIKINFIKNNMSINKLNEIKNFKLNYYDDEDILIFESYQIHLIDFLNNKILNKKNFLFKYIKNLNTTNNEMVINDSIIKICYNLNLFNIVDKILELSFNHSFTAKEYYYTKKLSILFYTNSIGKLNKLELKKTDLDLIKNDNKPLMWLSCKYFIIKQKKLEEEIFDSIEMIIQSYILYEKFDLKNDNFFQNDKICETIIKNFNTKLLKYNTILTSLFLINSEYVKKNINIIKLNGTDIDLIIKGLNNKRMYKKYGVLLFNFHSTMPQFVNSMLIIDLIRNSSLKFYKDICNISKEKIVEIIEKDKNTKDLFDLIHLKSNFPFSYHGKNSKELFEKKNKIVKYYLEYKYKKLDFEFKSQKSFNKIRIAFFSNFLSRKHSVFKDRHQIIKHLSKDTNFKVYVITFDNLREDIKENYKDCIHIKLSNELIKSVEKIRSLYLDFLVFCEIGMDYRAYYMAFYKMANIHINTWGHSDTSGIEHIDYFLSSKYYEDKESQKNYTEKLILLDSLCTCYVNPTEKYNLIKKTYNYSLFENQDIILCNQTLFKILPIFDDYIIKILEANQKSIIVFIDSVKNLRGKFMERLSKKCNNLNILNRIKITDHGYSHDEFVNLVKLSKIQLDVYPFGGCNSTLECLSLGIPVVTQPSRIINGRFTTGFYTKININELVACNKIEYINIVNRLLQDKKFYNNIKNKIIKKKNLLFMEEESCTTWKIFLKNTIKK